MIKVCFPIKNLDILSRFFPLFPPYFSPGNIYTFFHSPLRPHISTFIKVLLRAIVLLSLFLNGSPLGDNVAAQKY